MASSDMIELTKAADSVAATTVSEETQSPVLVPTCPAKQQKYPFPAARFV